MRELLKILGVEEQACWKEIKQGYLDSVRVWHPDRFTRDPRLHQKAEETTKRIHQALRRVQEIRAAIELSEGRFDENVPLIELFYRTEAASAVLEKKPSKTVTAINKRPDPNNHNLNRSNPRQKRVTKTMIMKHRSRHSSFRTNALIASAFLLLIASIGAVQFDLLSGKKEIVFPPRNDTRVIEFDPKESLQEIMQTAQPPIQLERELDRIERSRVLVRPKMINSAANCDIESVSRLLGQGEDINIADSQGQTALVWAAKRNCAGLVSFLLHKGANANLASSNGFTAYRWAKWYRNDGAISAFDNDRRQQRLVATRPLPDRNHHHRQLELGSTQPSNDRHLKQ